MSNTDEERQGSPRKMSAVEKEMRDIMESCMNIEMKSQALLKLRHYLAMGVPVKDVISVGAMDAAIDCLQQNGDLAVQMPAIEFMNTFTCFAGKQNQELVELGCVPILLEHCYSPHLVLRRLAMAVLSSVVGCDVVVRTYLFKQRFDDHIIAMIHPDAETSLLVEVAGALRSLCQHDKPPLSKAQVQKIINAFTELMAVRPDRYVVWYVVIGVQYLACGRHNDQLHLADTLMAGLVQALGSDDAPLLKSLSNIFCNMTDGPYTHTSHLVELGLLSKMPPLLMHNESFVRFGACWIVTNVVGHGEKMLQRVLDAGLLPGIRYNIVKGTRQCIFLVYTMIKKSNNEQLLTIYKSGLISALCDCLHRTQGDVLVMALRGLITLLYKIPKDFIEATLQVFRQYGVVRQLIVLRGSSNSEVHAKTTELLENCFDE